METDSAPSYSTYANPTQMPDESQYLRLLRLQRLRTNLLRDNPQFPQRLQQLFETAAVKSFLQALPTKNINAEEDSDIAVTGAIPRGIQITNSIIMRKMLIKNLFELASSKEALPADMQALKDEIALCASEYGIGQDLAQQAIDAATRFQGRARFSLVSN